MLKQDKGKCHYTSYSSGVKEKKYVEKTMSIHIDNIHGVQKVYDHPNNSKTTLPIKKALCKGSKMHFLISL